MFFSYISANGVSNLSILPATLILILVVMVGIVADMIGISVTVANEEEFHAKATKKIAGSKTSIELIKRASKVASISSDVIGDICGVLSGAIGTMIAMKIVQTTGASENIQFLISALIACIMVGGKAIGKDVGIANATKIVHTVGKGINKVSLKKQ
ncbi:MAG: hypothetical protein IJV31_10830, partial [Clostridia bacterium]|nr:hypothetical protein [Clostridia bacterium]